MTWVPLTVIAAAASLCEPALLMLAKNSEMGFNFSEGKLSAVGHHTVPANSKPANRTFYPWKQ